MGTTCAAVFLGRQRYEDALDLQMRICGLKKEGRLRDVLLLLEHAPVITLGRNRAWTHLLVPESHLQSKGISRFQTDRGGDITFHGPGQLVGYPILQLDPGERDVHRFMRNLEESLIRLLAAFGIEAGRREKLTGVWTDQGKIAAMGVHISRWITRHGFALNVDTDLSFFNLIVPCGLSGKTVTTMKSILGTSPSLEEVARSYVGIFGAVFGREMRELSHEALLRQLAELDGSRPLASREQLALTRH